MVLRSATVLATLVVALVALISSAPARAADPRVTVTRADWNDVDGFVDLEGTSDPHGTVFITDADSGNVLATTTATAGGTWSEQVMEFSSVPCRVQAASGGGVAAADVLGAPGDCGPRPVTIAAAGWDSGAEHLMITGQSESYRRIVVRDADSGAELATVRSDASGMWAAEIGDLSPVSCTVTAESDTGFPVEAAVAGAPAGCGSPLMGARLYAEKLCNDCHGDDGAGNPGKDIEGEPARAIRRALRKEEVHFGIDATYEEAQAIAVFLDDPGPLPELPVEDFSNPTRCQTCHPRQYKEWSGSMMAYSAVSPTFSALVELPRFCGQVSAFAR